MKLFRTYFFKLLYSLKIGHYLLSSNRKKYQVPVLVFHKVIPEYDAAWPGIHPHLFEDILCLLKKHYTILPITDLFTKPVSELKNSCFITFDDGYKDYLDYAYPILKKHNIPSSIFVLPHQISNNGYIWTSAVTFLVKHYPFSEIKDFLKQHSIIISENNQLDFFKLNLEITKLLCDMVHADRTRIIDSLRNKFVADNRIIENELLSFDELKKFDPTLTHIGSHSLTHPSFKKETNASFIESELKDSKAIIERELGREVISFAFPFANYDNASINAAKKTYKLCFTGLNDFINLNEFKANPDVANNLKRFNIHQDSAEEVFFLINGFHKRLRS